MTLLDVIAQAAANARPPSSQEEHPITLNTLNPDNGFVNLKPQSENTNLQSLVNPLTGWGGISQNDDELADLNKKIFTNLRRKLKDTHGFHREDFIRTFDSFLEKVKEKTKEKVEGDSNDAGYTSVLIEKLGVYMGQDVVALVLEACLAFEIWELVEALIVNRLVFHRCYSSLVQDLATKKRSDLLCLCIKHSLDLGSSELLCILKYFLCPSKDALSSMVKIRKDWESQALQAIGMASDEVTFGMKSQLAKEASILLMVAHDGFSDPELCLHYLLASSNVDEVVFSSAIGKLGAREMMNLIRYLRKWLSKYDRFPQAVPCPKASSSLGLKACDWVPKLENVVKCVSFMLDENFSSLVLQPEFHEELKSIDNLVSSLAFESQFCCLIANAIEKLKAGGHN